MQLERGFGSDDEFGFGHAEFSICDMFKKSCNLESGVRVIGRRFGHCGGQFRLPALTHRPPSFSGVKIGNLTCLPCSLAAMLPLGSPRSISRTGISSTVRCSPAGLGVSPGGQGWLWEGAQGQQEYMLHSLFCSHLCLALSPLATPRHKGGRTVV